MFGLLFGMCQSHHVVEVRLHEESKARKKIQKDMKKIKQALYPNKTPSPPGSEERESNPPTPFEQCYAGYENFDPSQSFALYASTSHMGFVSQQGGAPDPHAPSFAAPPPPEPPRASMVDEFTASIFGGPTYGMASTTMPPFVDSSIYTGPGTHWTTPHDYFMAEDQ
jgi:hypothetical protein